MATRPGAAVGVRTSGEPDRAARNSSRAAHCLGTAGQVVDLRYMGHALPAQPAVMVLAASPRTWRSLGGIHKLLYERALARDHGVMCSTRRQLDV